jgi:hypothetical protein
MRIGVLAKRPDYLWFTVFDEQGDSCRLAICRVGLRGRSPMTKPDEHHDYLTSSVAGLQILFIILVGNALVAA